MIIVGQLGAVAAVVGITIAIEAIGDGWKFVDKKVVLKRKIKKYAKKEIKDIDLEYEVLCNEEA